MKKKGGKKASSQHLEIQKISSGGYCGVIRTSYREDGKVKHKNLGRITNKTLSELKVIQAAMRGDAISVRNKNTVKVKNSKEYGASYAILHLAKELELDKAIYSKTTVQWVRDSLAMITGRLIYAGSKLSLSHQWKDSALWELMGVEGSVDVDSHCYKSMDYLLERQPAIQKSLSAKHLGKGALVLYDITSSYFEGEYSDSELVKFGYNRDGKKGHEQVVIGLLCNSEGCPVGVEVFPGNTQDAQTVLGKIEEIRKSYGMTEVVFVGDRGMVTHANYEKIKDIDGLNTISALTHKEIVNLLEKKTIQFGLFDEQGIIEVVDPENTGRRYCLCINPNTEAKERNTRKALIEKTRQLLDNIASSKRRASAEKISLRVGKVFAKTKMGKFIKWEVSEGRLKWELIEDKIKAEELLDGRYIIASDVPKTLMDKQEIVASYKKLAFVEKAFRNLKTVKLEMRPMYHKTDDRIRSHVFLCMLAYYLQWHMVKRLSPLLTSKENKGKDRKWTFENIIERLKSIRREDVEDRGAEYKIISTLDAEQENILDLLRVRL